MNTLRDTTESGMPEHKSELPPSVRDYYQFRDYLHTVDGVAVYKNRIVVPPALREEVLAGLHAAHQGVSSMLARAEASVFWPDITVDISNKRNTCNACNRMALSSHPLHQFHWCLLHIRSSASVQTTSIMKEEVI